MTELEECEVCGKVGLPERIEEHACPVGETFRGP